MNTLTLLKIFSSLLFRLLLVLLGFVLCNVLAVYMASVDNVWRGYQPWLGEPEELIRHVDTGGADIFQVRLSEGQLADLVKTLRLKGDANDPAQADFHLKSAQPIKLGESYTPDQIYDISLQYPMLSVPSDNYKDLYELYIHRVFPTEGESKMQEFFTVAKRYPEPERSSMESILGWGTLLLFFFLPALLARLFVRKREGLFPFKELLFTFIGACILYVPFVISANFSMVMLASSSSDGVVLWLFASVIACPFVCAPSSLILYLIIGLYRWWRRGRGHSAQPTVPDAGTL